MICYLNGVQQLSFVDSGNLAALAGSPQMIRFFKDNTTEDAAGAVARIRLYDKVMPPSQVASLDRLPGSTVAQPAFINLTRLPGPQLSFTLTGTPGMMIIHGQKRQAWPNLENYTFLSSYLDGLLKK